MKVLKSLKKQRRDIKRSYKRALKSYKRSIKRTIRAYRRDFKKFQRKTKRFSRSVKRIERRVIRANQKRLRTLKKNYRPRYAVIAGLTMIILGVIGAGPTLYYQYSNNGSVNAEPFSTHVSTVPAPAPQKVPITGNPISISIPSAYIPSVPVIPGYYDDNTKEWTLTLDKAQFASMTTPPNDTVGNTFIYGHYRPEVFAYLHTIQPGAEATITTDNGLRFHYIFRDTFAVSPEDTSVLAPYQGKPILTIQTCSGTWFQNRQLYTFDFKSVEKV